MVPVLDRMHQHRQLIQRTLLQEDSIDAFGVELHVQSFSNKVTLATAPLPTAKTRQKEKAQQPSETPNSEKTLQMQFTRPGIYASGAAAARVGTASVVVDTASVLSAGPGASELTVGIRIWEPTP